MEQKSRFYFFIVAAIFFYEFLSGIYITLGREFSEAYQMNILFHTLVGFLFFLPFIIFQYLHFFHARAGWRKGFRLTGYIAYAVILIISLTGIHLTFIGSKKDAYLMSDTHLWVGFGGTLLILVHVFIKIFRNKSRFFDSFGITPRKALLVVAGSTVVIFLIQSLCVLVYREPVFAQTIPPSYSLTKEDNPFHPSEAATESGKLVDARLIGNSVSCASGGCHKDIYDQWNSSAHRYSSTDVFYRKAEQYMIETAGKEASRYCAGCHDPVALLSGGINPGAGFDTPHSDEGSSCILCHGISKIRHLKGSGSYAFDPPKRYLFAQSENDFGQMLNRFLIRTAPELHKIEFSKEAYSTPEYCAVCHKQYIKDPNNWGWVKLQDQYGEWLASPFSGRNDKGFNKEEVRTCMDCHMPPVDSQDPSAGKDGKVSSHRFIAANTAVPWLDGDEEQYKLTEQWLKGRKLLVSIYAPRDKTAVRNQAFIDNKIYELSEPIPYVTLGEDVELNVAVTNARVGHGFPNGPLDIYESWLEVKIVDAQNNIIFHSGGLDEKGYVKTENTRFFFTVALNRKGTLVAKHNLWHMIGNAYKRLILPGKTDLSTYNFKVPYWAKGDITVMARVRYRRFNKWYTDWVFENENVELPIIDMARDTINIPIRNKPEQEASVD